MIRRAAITSRRTKRSQNALRLHESSTRPKSTLSRGHVHVPPRISLMAASSSMDWNQSSSLLHSLVSCDKVSGFQARRHQSSSSSSSSPAPSSLTEMEDATTVEEVMTALEHQMIEDEQRRSIDNPTPYFSLLHYPSRAAWRSTDHILGAKRSGQNSKRSAEDESVLSQTQFNLLQHSDRTSKQLRRTYKRIMEVQKSLAIKRERERRLAANLSNPKQQQQLERSMGKPEGSIEDSKGRSVGDWREKKTLAAPPASLCDDPSVALALSLGLQNSKKSTNVDVNAETMDEMLLKNDPMLFVKSAKNASRLAKSKDQSSTGSREEKPVGYGSEQTLTNMRYRFGPNHDIMKRVLLEVQSLLGGKHPKEESPQSGGRRKTFQPKRVLDFGCGVGSSSAAALDVFGVSRGADTSNGGTAATDGVDWIHSIDASQAMRETTEKVLQSVLESAPWESKDEVQSEQDAIDAQELAHYERVMKQIQGDPDPRRAERQRKRMQKWERTWVKQTNFRTRLTFGESIVDASSFYSDDEVDKDDRPPLPWQQQLDEQKEKARQNAKAQAQKIKSQQKQGSFDLILCSYTLSEFPNVPSSLAATALLWEKLAPNGVMVFVEPGTPDGFNILRSVRSMLLECCPPPEIGQQRQRAFENVAENEDDEGVLGIEEDSWHEECHVIAPCTHNGTCPMSRHQRNHVKKYNRFGKYDTTVESGNEDDEEEGIDPEKEDSESGNSKGLMSDWESMDEEEREEMKMLVGVEDVGDEEMIEMMKYIDANNMDDDDDEEDYDEEEDDEGDSDSDEEAEYVDEQAFYNIDQEGNEKSSKKSTTKQTDVFDASFCSFVHNFPGGTSRRKGEKFSYLVLQKRVNDPTHDVEEDKSSDALMDADVVDMLSKSIHHAQKLKEEEHQLRRETRDFDIHGHDKDSDFHKEYFNETYGEDINYHNEQGFTTLQKAAEVEGEYLDSTADSLGLELLNGDDRRRGWGRLVRAPLKRKGHVLLDYCSSGCGGGNNSTCPKRSNDDDANMSDDDGDSLPDGTKGRITRQKVSRGWSARAAPGAYSAARKARWGGLWPDLSERVKLTERMDESERRKGRQKMLAMQGEDE